MAQFVLRAHPTKPNASLVIAQVSRVREAESLRKKNPGTSVRPVGSGVRIAPVNPFPPIAGARTATSRGFVAIPVVFGGA